jgi:hypothetical protein
MVFFLAFFFDRAGDEGGVSFEENDEHFLAGREEEIRKAYI